MRFILSAMNSASARLKVDDPLEADWWRAIPIIEPKLMKPKRPFRWVQGTIIGVIVLFAVAAGSGYYLRPLMSQHQGRPTTTPVSPKSPPPVSDEPPKFASGLRPIIEPVSTEVPQPAPKAAAPSQPPNVRLQPRPVRKAASPLAASGVPPNRPSSPIKF